MSEMYKVVMTVKIQITIRSME